MILYYNEILSPKTVELLESAKNRTTRDKNYENVSHSEIIEIVLVHCNILNNDCQQDTRVLHIFAPNKSFSQLLKT